MKRVVLAALCALVFAPAAQAKDADVRFSTFNASLNRFFEGQLEMHLATPNNQQAKNVAETIQRYRPDVLLINEFDYWATNPQRPVDLFRDNYLEVSQNGAAPIEYPYSFIAPSNTGIHSGFDLQQRRWNRLDPVGVRVRRRRLRVRRVPGQVRDGRVLQVPDRRSRRADVPALPVDGHAGQPDADAVLLARGGGDLPPLVEEPLGPTDHHWEEDSALPGLAPDPAGVRRARGPKRPSEQRRDPLLGRLHHAGRLGLHLRRPRWHAAA